MSSNHNHIIQTLSRKNYEVAFLLYVDDELTAEEKEAVDNFVLLHPDLNEELDLLCSTKLPADVVSFQDKEALLADSMKVNAVDESLLLHIDNELQEWEAKMVEAQLGKDETYAQQHQLLLKTKLRPEPVFYPYKKELYRHTERKITPYWLRIAAAVLFIAGAGTAIWMALDDANGTQPVVAVATPKEKIQQPAPAIKEIENPVLLPKKETVAVGNQKTLPLKSGQMAKNNLAVVKPALKKKMTSTFSKAHTAGNTDAIAAIVIDKKKTLDNLKTGLAETKIKEPSFNNKAVTSETAATYVITDAAAKTTVPVHAVAQQNSAERSVGSVKGFLRKATRFIERRTGIKTVNDDDELLVGAVALKL
jgi:hypothetical protein